MLAKCSYTEHSTASIYTGFGNSFFSVSHITQCYEVIKDYIVFLQVIMHKTSVFKHFLEYHLFSLNDLFYILHYCNFHQCILVGKQFKLHSLRLCVYVFVYDNPYFLEKCLYYLIVINSRVFLVDHILNLSSLLIMK